MSKEYDAYLSDHRFNVSRGYNWLYKNLPEIFDGVESRSATLRLNHDKSKNDPDEYKAYDNYFYGKNRSYGVVVAFKQAWLEHIHRNPHHWQHWVLINDEPEEGEVIIEMPYEYIIEMICAEMYNRTGIAPSPNGGIVIRNPESGKPEEFGGY